MLSPAEREFERAALMMNLENMPVFPIAAWLGTDILTTVIPECCKRVNILGHAILLDVNDWKVPVLPGDKEEDLIRIYEDWYGYQYGRGVRKSRVSQRS